MGVYGARGASKCCDGAFFFGLRVEEAGFGRAGVAGKLLSLSSSAMGGFRQRVVPGCVDMVLMFARGGFIYQR